MDWPARQGRSGRQRYRCDRNQARLPQYNLRRHDHGALVDTFAGVPAASGRPTAVIAHTVKGHPISFMSDDVAWHNKVPSAEQLATALSELEAR